LFDEVYTSGKIAVYTYTSNASNSDSLMSLKS
jgi:hypothetical protein